jgi:hypothetical protein
MNDNSISFVKIATNEVIDLIATARNRIIFVKPAFLVTEMKAILSAAEKGIEVTLYMEAGDSAIRYGFGETAALKLLEEKLDKVSICLADRIRVGILVVDDNSSVYMPNLTMIEEESSNLSFPNGFQCSSQITKDIVKQFLTSKNEELNNQKPDNVIIFPGGYIPTFAADVVIDDIRSSLENLEQNPATDPTKLQKVNFYRNNYKILKMQICGIRIRDKQVSLRPFYSFLPEIDKRLKSSWEIFTSEDIDLLQSTKLFEIELEKLKKEYLIDAGRFGYIIEKNKKDEFITAIKKLKDDYTEYFRGNPSEAIRKRFENNITEKAEIERPDIKEILKTSRLNLEAYLYTLCPTDEDFIAKIFNKNRYLKSKYKGSKRDAETIFHIISEFIEFFILDDLKFADVDELIESIDIKCDCYDVSDELLFDNNDFTSIIDKYKLDLRSNSCGYEVIK